ncbi:MULTISPECIES: GspH/FimT family pseudopilin [Halomonadaceae]|uniref:GspH/FimT family pseudopilin n=1 Tax=Halomonadaceae TaxID=28256 RepID=UPI0015975243|nr:MULTISPECIES: GspH/FimT family pseudopilin [Halomonas]QJQ94278.1 prepilin-type N-terminal cleavage/methylation domain-containing protein [Halomonas sp. PA5]
MPMMISHRTRAYTTKAAPGGFTLIELLVVIAVIVIMATWAVPGYSHFIERQQVAAEVLRLKSALAMARSSAITRGAVISLCPVASLEATHCAFDDWSQMLVIVEGQAAGGSLAGTQRLRVIDPGSGPAVTFNRRLPIRHQASGWTRGHNGTFLVCGKHGQGARIILNNTGRARSEVNNSGSC